ncbi:putative capsid protein [Wenzhou shrimp virus 9]|uniref:putative capsid protein n=1 Tax=Wenzhou shrimp virus 9 TaxID=1923656 RepID=UPI00090CAEE5|nr:putative capsid protein [Wenzhou shrimp virus 9]APG75820.1 putative capsid protein [Wenzhou shrimp virus 9]
MTNQHVCPICKRSFRTAQGLADHKRDRHEACSTGPAPKPQRVRPKREQRQAAPVSVPTSSGPARYSNRVTLQGSNERFRTDDYPASRLKTGTLLTTIPVSPDLVPRLSTQAKAYQRIKYHSVALHIDAKGSTAQSGGYLAVFISDITDEEISLERAGSFGGSVGKKYWENATVTATNLTPLFYTSRGEDERLWSPGYFAIYCDGSSNTAISLTYRLTWSVTLSVPSSELKQADVITTMVDLWPTAGKASFSDKDGSEENLFEPSLPVGTVVRFPYAVGIEYKEGAGDTGTVPIMFAVVTASSGLKASNDRVDTSVVWQSDVSRRLLYPKSIRLIVEKRPGEVSRAGQVSQFSPCPPTSLASSETPSTETVGNNENRPTCSVRFTTPSSSDLMKSMHGCKTSMSDLRARPVCTVSSTLPPSPNPSQESILLTFLESQVPRYQAARIVSQEVKTHEFPLLHHRNHLRLEMHWDLVPLMRGRRIPVYELSRHFDDDFSLKFTINNTVSFREVVEAVEVLNRGRYFCLGFIALCLQHHFGADSSEVVPEEFPSVWYDESFHYRLPCRSCHDNMESDYSFEELDPEVEYD